MGRRGEGDGGDVLVEAPHDGPRLYAKTRFTWIRRQPSAESPWIGYLWLGGVVALRDEKPRGGPGCSALWQPVEPRGWVCPNGAFATLDPNDPVVTALAPFRPNLESPWPHRYGSVFEATERYEVLPDARTQRARERYRSRHLAEIERARRGEPPSADFLGVDFSPASKKSLSLPRFPTGVTEGRTKMPRRSTLAYAEEVEQEGRTFLLAADMSWVPKDYVKPFPQSEFQGVELSDATRLVAFFRTAGGLEYRLDASGALERSGKELPRLGSVFLTGRVREVGADVFHETISGAWVREADAVIPHPQGNTPWGAVVGRTDETGRAPAGRATWIEVSILGGWLLAYEGTRPVYATLISAGHGGSARPGADPLLDSSTPTGHFRINGKFATATMTSPTGIVHGDVPWTQNFVGPYAIHAAYWHDDFGSLQSGGCVNVSPRDGKWLFDFSEPSLPSGWHGVRSGDGPSTSVVLHD